MSKVAEKETSIQHRSSLGQHVEQLVRRYLAHLGDQPATDLHTLVIEEVETALLTLVLQLVNGNQTKAAIMLGLSRNTLRKKMALYGLE